MKIKKTAMGVGAVIIAGLAFVWVMQRAGVPEAERAAELPAQGAVAPVRRAERAAESDSAALEGRKQAGERPVYVVRADGTAGGAKSSVRAEPDAGSHAAVEIAQQAVERWDALVDAVAERKQAPDRAEGERVKRAYAELDAADKLPAINQALNLIPDEQFAVLYPILYDKEQPEEVLDAIFSDALNRSEEIKIPLMKELRKDKTHPMFFESARILDVIEN